MSSSRDAAAERAAGGGQHQGFDLVGRAVLEALEERRVLAVDREQPPSAPLPRRERELACRDETLLVREREVDAALERPERRGQAGEADDGVQHDVRLGPLEQLDEVAADLGQRREPVDRLRARGRSDELELRVRVDDLERLPADRAGGAQEGDPLHWPSSVAAGGLSVRCRRASEDVEASATDGEQESRRCGRASPPWPPSSRPCP